MKKLLQIVFQMSLMFMSSISSIAQTGPMGTSYNIDFGFVYRLVSVANGKDTEVEDALLSKGTRVQQYWGYSSNGSADGHGQEWVFIPAGSVIKADGRTVYLVRIINYGFLDYLSAGRGGGQVTLEKLNPNGANIGTFWEIIPTGNRHEIKLRSNSTNTFLQSPNDSNDGSALTLAPEANIPAQRFKFTKFSKDFPPLKANTPAVLVAANNRSKALDVTGCVVTNNNLLEIWDKGSNNTCQQFNFSHAGVGIGSIFRLSPVIAPTFNVRNQDPTAQFAGANIVTGTPASFDHLNYWIIVKCVRDPGKYMFFNFNGMCMEVWNNRTDRGATIGQNAFYNTDNQKWIIESIN